MKNTIKKLNDILPKTAKRKIFFLFILMLGAALSEVFGIGLILVFVSIVSNPNNLASFPWLALSLSSIGINNAQDLLVYGSLALMIVFVLKNAYLILFHYVQARFIYKLFFSTAMELFKKYMNAEYVFHLHNNTARLIQNVTVEAVFLVNHIMLPILLIILESILILSIVVFLIIVEPILTLLVLFFVGGAGGLFLKLLKSRTLRYGTQAHKDRTDMIQKVSEGLGGFKEIMVMNRQSWFIDQFQSSAQAFARAETFRQVSKQSSKPVVETVAVVGMLLVALALVWQGRGVGFIVPVLTLFGVAAFRLIPELDKLISNYNILKYYEYVLTPIHDDLVSLHKPQKNIKKELLPQSRVKFKNKIELDKVSYSYPGSSKIILKEISLVIKKGQAVGFVGTSGAGKTTIVDLILGLLKPEKGIIKVDGIDIRKNIVGWQKNIGYIPQFIYLSDDTIRNNIAFGLAEKDINEKQLLAAIKTAQLEKLIKSLPDGINTVVGERGVRLSGGQRQRIGIARALYHNPEVLIMDEATSSLDNNTEQYVIKAIERLRKERTIIIIAHRLSTVKNCDILFSIENGSIISKGNYNYLLKNNAKFKKLANY